MATKKGLARLDIQFSFCYLSIRIIGRQVYFHVCNDNINNCTKIYLVYDLYIYSEAVLVCKEPLFASGESFSRWKKDVGAIVKVLIL